MSLVLTPFYSTNVSYFPLGGLTGTVPCWDLSHPHNVWDDLLDYLTLNCGSLGDPGGNGLIMRTALNVTVPAVAGVDYQAAIVAPTWVALPYSNSWSDFGSGLRAGAYCKNAVGQLLLRGAIKPGTTGTGDVQVATLPAGFHPTTDGYATIVGFVGGTTPTVTRLKVDTSGNVTIFNTSTTGSLFEIDCVIELF